MRGNRPRLCWTFYLGGLVTLHVLHHPEPLSDHNPVFFILALPATRAQDDPVLWGWLELPGEGRWEPGPIRGALPKPPIHAAQTNKRHLCHSQSAVVERGDENRWPDAVSTSAPPCPGPGVWSCSCIEAFSSPSPLSVLSKPLNLRPSWTVQIRKKGDQGSLPQDSFPTSSQTFQKKIRSSASSTARTVSLWPVS